jgi:hypothetical protein
MCFAVYLVLTCFQGDKRPISSYEAFVSLYPPHLTHQSQYTISYFIRLTFWHRSAIAEREARGKKPVGNMTKDRDVIYNTDGRGAPKRKEPGLRWRWEPWGGTGLWGEVFGIRIERQLPQGALERLQQFWVWKSLLASTKSVWCLAGISKQ